MGHGPLSDRHTAGGGDVVDDRQHERTLARHSRNDLRRTPGTGRPDGPHGLRLADIHYAATGQDGARSDRRHRRTGRHLRLRVVGRIVLDSRPGRSVDHGTDRQGLRGRRPRRQRPQRNRVGGAPHTGRLCIGPRQPSPHHDLSERRPGKLPLCPGRRRLRPRNGLLRRPGRNLQLLGRLRPGRLRSAARLRSPRMGLFPDGGRRDGRLHGLCDGPQPGEQDAAVGGTPRESNAQERSSTACATTTKGPRWT